MYEVKDGTLTVGQHTVFSGLSLMLREGELTAVTGLDAPDAALLLQSLVGIRRLSSGFITLDGDLLSALSAPYLRRAWAYVPARLDMQGMTVKDTFAQLLASEASPDGMSTQQLMAEWALIGLPEACYEAAWGDLAEPVQRRVMLSFACLLKHRYLFVAEPTAHLDGHEWQLVADYLHSLARQGMGILLTTADEELAKVCSQHINLNTLQ